VLNHHHEVQYETFSFSSCPVWMSTERIGFLSVDSGFIATRTTTGWPLVFFTATQ
jgi:hypothetical protein